MGNHENDRKYLRFLWMQRGGRLPFGVISAPAILTNIIESIVNRMTSQTREILNGAFYMDDMITESNLETELIEVVEVAQVVFGETGFSMHKMAKNSNLLMNHFKLPHQDCKVLGMNWYCETDAIGINWKSTETIDIKRKLLSLIG